MSSFKEIVSALKAEDVVEQTFGQRLRILRRAHGLSQTELAEIAGISKGALSQWELGGIEKVSADPLLRIAFRFGVDAYYLRWGSKTPPKMDKEIENETIASLNSWLDNLQ